MRQSELVTTWMPHARCALFAIVVAVPLTLAGAQLASAATASGATRSAARQSNVSTTSAHCPSGTAVGATSKQITVAATIIDITGGSFNNSTVGVPSAESQKSNWNEVANSINHSGGVGCRKIVMSFYDVNPVDAAAVQQDCLNIAAARPYIVLDSGALTDVGASNCIPGHKIPLVSQYLTQDDLTKYYPYYIQIGDIPSDSARNGILGLKQLGYFNSSKGFKKLGLLYHTCTPALVDATQAALTSAGVRGSKLVSYNLGCPAGQVDTAASLEQAVLSFKSAGVTDVTEAGVNDFGLFTQVAQQQNFKPHYLLDDPTVAATATTSGADAPNSSNLNGAVNIVAAGPGAGSTPGYKPSGGIKKCDDIYAAAGKPQRVYTRADLYGGVVCDYLWFVQALLDHAPKLQADTLASTMHSLGTLDLLAPINFSAAPVGKPYGVSFWQPLYYQESCSCWDAPDPAGHPPFK